MTAVVEQGFVAYLTGAGVGGSINAGTSMAKVPNSSQTVIVIAKPKRDVGRLYTLNLTVIVSTPAKVGNLTVTDHGNLVAAVKTALDLELDQFNQAVQDAGDDEDALAAAQAALTAAIAANTALNTALQTASGYQTRGCCPLQGPVDAQNEDMWQSTFDAEWGMDGPFN